MGIHGDFANERVAEAYKEMIAACERHGKYPGMAGIYNEAIMPRYIEMGARFILAGQDAAFLSAGAAQRTGFLHRLEVDDAGIYDRRARPVAAAGAGGARTSARGGARPSRRRLSRAAAQPRGAVPLLRRVRRGRAARRRRGGEAAG